MRQLFQELKRRNVYRVAVTYAAVAFVTLQAAQLVFPATTLEGLYDELVALAFVGFPIALVIAWAFELTPEGVRRTREAAEAPAGGAGEAGSGTASGSRTAMLALVGLGLLAAAGTGVWYLVGGGGESPAIEERTVAVLPFQVSGAGADTWRDGMVTLLSTGLDGAGELRAVPDRTVLAAWNDRSRRQGSAGGASTGEALSVAREVGARFAVVGSAVQLGGELTFAADVHATPSAERLGRVEVSGSPDSVTALTDSLTRRLLGLLLEESGAGLPAADVASQLTRSLPALESFLAGERHYRAGVFAAAVEDYRRAVGSDSTFALAWWRLAMAEGWQGDVAASSRYRRRAWEVADRLPRRQRRLLRASWLEHERGQSLPALDTLRRLSGAYPDDPAVWYELGEVIYHNNLPGGWPEAERAFLRAVELDPGHGPYHIHPVQLAVALHHDSALAARRRSRHPNPENLEPEHSVAMALAFGDSASRARALERIRGVQGPDELPVGQVAPYLVHPSTRDVLSAALAAYPEARVRGPALVQDRLQRGRLARALHHAARVSGHPTATCGLTDAVSLGYPVPDPAVAPHLGPLDGGEEPLGGDGTLRLLCTGVYRLERGPAATADRVIARLERVAADTTGAALALPARAADAVDVLRGYRAWRDGELERAAGLLTRSVVAPTHFPHTSRGLWRGDVLHELGRREEAEGWYLASWWHPLAHERLGRLYEGMGRPEEAAAAYRRFVAAWEDADPPLQERVQAAREALRGLTGSGEGAGD